MGGSNARLEAIDAVKSYEAPAVSFAADETPGAIFGENVFSKSGNAMGGTTSAVTDNGSAMDTSAKETNDMANFNKQ